MWREKLYETDKIICRLKVTQLDKVDWDYTEGLKVDREV